MKKIIATVILLLAITPAFAKNEHKADKHKDLPPGLQKKVEGTGQLPPGWQKKLKKGDTLDLKTYELVKPHRVKPETVLLPPLPGTEIFQIEDRIFRIKNDTREILDILGL